VEWSPLRWHEVHAAGVGARPPHQVQIPPLQPGGLGDHGGDGPSRLKEHHPPLDRRVCRQLPYAPAPVQTYSRTWHVNELHARLRGGKAHVYVVEDDQRSLIALELIGRRDREATPRLLRKARAGAGWHGTPYPKPSQPSRG